MNLSNRTEVLALLLQDRRSSKRVENLQQEPGVDLAPQNDTSLRQFLLLGFAVFICVIGAISVRQIYLNDLP